LLVPHDIPDDPAAKVLKAPCGRVVFYNVVFN
jgi:hypothetical protein